MSMSQSLKPVKVNDNLYGYTIDQLREIAIVVTENQHNDSIITQQEQLIIDFKRLSTANDSIILKQQTMLLNRDLYIANEKNALDKRKEIHTLEKKRLKDDHKAKQNKLRLVVVIETVIVILVLLVK